MSRMAKGIKRDLGPCSDPDCRARAGAKGWCTRHYGTLWRARLLPWQKEGVTLAEQLAEIRRAEAFVPGSARAADSAQHAEDRRASLECELKWARRAYDIVVGWRNQVWWSNRIKELQAALAQMPEGVRAQGSEVGA